MKKQQVMLQSKKAPLYFVMSLVYKKKLICCVASTRLELMIQIKRGYMGLALTYYAPNSNGHKIFLQIQICYIFSNTEGLFMVIELLWEQLRGSQEQLR
jgi:hypothetical protein